MNTRYLEDLRLLKDTFDASNEIEPILGAITSHTAPRSLRLLDVGIGEGNAILKVTEQLSARGYVPHLTGVDLYISSRLRTAAPRNSLLIESDYLYYHPTIPFDVVVATQSLYYFDDLRRTLGHLLQHTVTSGILIITTWSQRCALFELHSRFAPFGDGPRLCTEVIATELRRLDSAATINIVRTVGTVDISKWRQCGALRKSAYRILARADGASDSTQFYAFEEYLHNMPDTIVRENGTIIFQRTRAGEMR